MPTGFDIPKIECASPLGIENGQIPDSAMVASSRHNQYWGPERGRLNKKTEGKTLYNNQLIKKKQQRNNNSSNSLYKPNSHSVLKQQEQFYISMYVEFKLSLINKHATTAAASSTSTTTIKGIRAVPVLFIFSQCLYDSWIIRKTRKESRVISDV